MKTQIYDQLSEVIESLSLDPEKKELIFLLSSFQELISCFPDDEENSLDNSLDMLFEFLEKRPDEVLNQIHLLSRCGLIKSVEKLSNGGVRVVSYIDSGFGRNWDGTGCEATKTGSNIEQTMILSKDSCPRYSNRHNVELKRSDIPRWTPNITN